jgi:3-oxoacyl-[acyl-carrier protein] reductase
MNLGISNRLALVTGASRGIGRAIATALAAEGCRLLLVARSEEGLEAVRSKLSTPKREHRSFCFDLMKEDAVPHLVEMIRAANEDPAIIVHNLGGSLAVPTFAPSSDWQKVWRFNVGIGHELNRAFIPGMVAKRWGRIVHLSTLSTMTYNGYPPYVSAKCALDGYVKAVNREVSKDNVIISAVAPGAIYSEGRHFAKLQKENPAALEEYFNQHLPIRRLGTAEEVAAVVAVLCSESASFMAGSIVGVDGGGM